ncbi:MAG: hypothetical protein JJD92_06220 [Frankiaceae bacterium]|nr:hypothetical protein [Frankiaceae bacterium]
MNILGVVIKIEKASDTSTRQRWVRRGIAVTAASAVMIGGGVAFAFWSTSGNGAGIAQAKTFAALTVTSGTAPTGQLYPGLTADGTAAGGDLVLSVTNSNPFPVQITGIAPNGTPTFTVTGATINPAVAGQTGPQANTACAATTGVSVITKTPLTVVYQSGTSVPANQSSAFTVTIKNVVSMGTASVTECQGASISFGSADVKFTYTSA